VKFSGRFKSRLEANIGIGGYVFSLYLCHGLSSNRSRPLRGPCIGNPAR
jgi:hypothetical protein